MDLEPSEKLSVVGDGCWVGVERVTCDDCDKKLVIAQVKLPLKLQTTIISTANTHRFTIFGQGGGQQKRIDNSFFLTST